MWQKYTKYLPARLELIPLCLLVVAIFIAVSNYPALPEKFPIDFDSAGMAKGWAGRGMVFLYPAVSAFIYILITGICVALAAVQDPKRLINMPRHWKDRLTDVQTEELRAALMRYLFVLKVIIQGLMAYLLYISIEIALERVSGTGTVPFTLFMLGIFCVIGLMLWKIFRLVFSKEAEAELS